MGDLYVGTFIFYSSNDTIIGSYPTPRQDLTWGCYNTSLLSSYDSHPIGQGQVNTSEITNNCSDDNTAARFCQELVMNDHDDWFLPSIDELELAISTLASNKIQQIQQNYLADYTHNPSFKSRTLLIAFTQEII